MRNKTVLIVCIIITLISSCTKTENAGLVGKWRLTEIYSGYTNGGNFLWNKVDLINSHTLEFTGDGKYSKRNEANGNFQVCFGTYQQLTTDIVEINSSCQTRIEQTRISELTSSELILSYQVIEGVIKYKYRAEK